MTTSHKDSEGSKEIPLAEKIENFSKSAIDKANFKKISIVIPICKSEILISTTLDSIFKQNYPDFEIIIVEQSGDKSLELIKAYRSEKVHVYSVSECKRYEMLNKGLSQATGEYINFLFPGDFYLYPETLQQIMVQALNSNSPPIVYCATLLRDGEVKILFRPYELELLKKGFQPSSLQSFWFRTDAIREIGKFNSNFQIRGGFELMCRFFLGKNFRYASLNRVLTDHEPTTLTRGAVFEHFWETMKVIYQYFGLWSTLQWLFIQKDIKRIIKLWLRSLKIAFSGR